MNDVAQVIQHAVVKLKKHGWTQRVYVNRTNNICVEEALFRALDVSSVHRTPRKSIYDLVKKTEKVIEDHVGMRILWWNDQRDQTLENIIETLTELTEKLEGSN